MCNSKMEMLNLIKICGISVWYKLRKLPLFFYLKFTKNLAKAQKKLQESEKGILPDHFIHS